MKNWKKVFGVLAVCVLVFLVINMLSAPDTQAVWSSVTERDEASLVTPQERWVVAETCTSADAEATALAVTERTFVLIVAAVDACSTTPSDGDGEIEFYMIPQWVNGLRFRAIGITADGTYTVNIRAGTIGAGEDYDKIVADGTDSDTSLVGTLAFIIGTQASTTSGYELADAVTVTASDWPAAWFSKTPGGEAVAEASIDMMGADFITVVPTTCSANSKLLIKGY